MDAGAWDERYAATDLVWSTAPNTFVATECADLPPGRAVDLAAGEGRNAIWLHDRGWDTTAVDFSEAGLEKGRRLAGDRSITWVHADVLEWQPDGTFDLAVIAYLHLPPAQRRAACRRAFAALRSGGTFLLVAHDTTNLTEGVGGPQDARVLMSAEDVLADLEGETFTVVHAGRVARQVTAAEAHRAEPSRTAYDCLVRLVRT
ncbi:bifunctional 2-polyprenyl-6-hydroxyphenol methylase/3-demethylubiquinol 3-O-methyltransferase UbiG [Nocardioides sp.]|uniref:class I SAM-dependent methyltransferase n=1 Tax=Nocardioides sp. TaxID=35761 RepID=UPI0027343914|nr:methyltransferase domain-containing protein [Nocardioides sp.]MDP3892644.1 methyltransferase domain-containing protein [Nocardioides sp.]